MPVSKTLEFDSAHFLQSLFAHDQLLLKLVDEALGVKITTRDGWVKIDGDTAAVECAVTVFRDLETARRNGADIDAHTFRFTLDQVASKKGDAAATSGGEALGDMIDAQVLGAPNRPPVKPRNANQLHYFQSIDAHPVVFGTGPAGTGKTYLAMAKGLAALKAGDVSRVVLSRPAVEAGEALGFLPGDLEEKIAPYLRPLYDALYDMLEPGEVEKMIDRNQIEIAPLAYMRGRTLNRAFIILDEAQNMTEAQMFMFLTRLGEDAKCVVTGDPSQTDLRPGVPSGLREALTTLRGVEGIGFCQFAPSDVVRHPIVRRIVAAYEAKRTSS